MVAVQEEALEGVHGLAEPVVVEALGAVDGGAGGGQGVGVGAVVVENEDVVGADEAAVVLDPEGQETGLVQGDGEGGTGAFHSVVRGEAE